MSSFFRSEEMQLCQFFLQSEAAYACVSELGELGQVQFKDLQKGVNAFQRTFVGEVRRCEEMERKLRYIEKEIRKEEMKIRFKGENPKAPAPKEMRDLETDFEKIESELREVNTNNEALRKNYLELTELRQVLQKMQMFFTAHGDDSHTIVEDAQQAMDVEAGTHGSRLGFLAGVIPREKVIAFERMLWFACRGNVFMRHEPIRKALADPSTGDPLFKDVFVVFFQGDKLKGKVKKICEGFKAINYPCPETSGERETMAKEVKTRLEDLKTVLSQTADHRHRVLAVAQKEIRSWIIKVEKMKAIYHAMNKCSQSGNSLIAECWVPVSSMDEVRMALRNGEKISGSNVPSIIQNMKTKRKPPTFFKTNMFTKGFQGIVDAYGMASYEEVNPALYTIITFPFIFAIMFGDAGHGFIMFMFGIYMVIFEKEFLAQRTDNEIWNTFLGGRYIITLMGLFSIYTGFIYNDIFSKASNIFGSAWRMHDYDTETTLKKEEIEMLTLDPLDFFRTGTPYPLGIDPVWQPAKNKISFLNSLKMKLAVIIGISQMCFGIMLSLFNHFHFRRYLNIFVEFIPEVIFLGCLFGYLVALIFFKWIAFESKESDGAPALLIQYINMFMMSYPKSKNDTEPGAIPTPDSQKLFYPHQKQIQISFVLASVCCVPILLLVKPFVMRSRNNAKVAEQERAAVRAATNGSSTQTLIVSDQKNGKEADKADGGKDNPAFKKDEKSDGNGVTQNSSQEAPAPAVFVEEEEDEKFDFGEIFIHQAIHTIEFCLGCISHTASYLRLWALSLAHAQLSEVLWNMVLGLGLKTHLDIFQYSTAILFFVFWYFWANLTVAVLLLMEGLSAFLHTLRLHWVEFQSKFYEGAGVKFTPLSFKFILKVDSMEAFK